jgi:hypothetical protein
MSFLRAAGCDTGMTAGLDSVLIADCCMLLSLPWSPTFGL